MPLIFQEEINTHTNLGIWKIEEEEDFFKQKVPVHRQVTHPHKRLQHLAGRFLLQHLAPGFPYHLIQIADTRKPFLPNEAYHFSISHCGNYAAAIVSKTHRVGIDVELATEKINRIQHKFISTGEMTALNPQTADDLTRIWSAKEAVFKWYGSGQVDFKEHIRLTAFKPEESFFDVFFALNNTAVKVCSQAFANLWLSYLSTPL